MRKYVIFSGDEEYLHVGYSDICNQDNVVYKTQYLYHPTKIRKLLNIAHYHSYIAKKIDLPLKKIWYKQYYPIPFCNGEEYVFIFFSRWQLIFNSGYLQYLREKYPGCKCVLFLQDIDKARMLDIQYEKTLFDHIMVFERNFADKNGIEYYPLVYGAEYNDTGEDRSIDLLFVGKAKGRYKLIKQIYDRLSKSGINCQFYLSYMDELPDASETGIHIVDFVPYEENVRLLKKSKCVLDIVPANTNCNTLRLSEAIVYNIKVLTNNTAIKNEEFYSEALISTYTSPDDIDVEFLKMPYSDVDYKFKEKISGKAFLQHLDQVLYQN